MLWSPESLSPSNEVFIYSLHEVRRPSYAGSSTNGLNASVFTIGNSVEAVNGINNGLGTFVQTYKDELS